MSDLKRGAFRVWDSEENRYIPSKLLYYYCINRDGELSNMSIDEEIRPVFNPHYTVEHFTGFYDADEQPVFENDILFDSDFNCEMTIKWFQGGGQWLLHYVDDGEDKSTIIEANDMDSAKVIGTIHDATT